MSKVLLIDDDPLMAELLTPVLSTLGMKEVIVAEDGVTALAHVDREIDTLPLVLCDLRMPGMDGIEFLRHLGSREFRGDVIIISGSDNRLLETVYDLAKAHRLNILAALEKPVTIKALGDALQQRQNSVPRAPIPVSEVVLDRDELARALRAGEILSYFQPKVDVKTRRIEGVETLVRWQHPDYGLIPPDRFISLAEECGLIDELTETVFFQAMRYAAAWQRMGLKLQVAVNISVNNLARLELPEILLSMASSLGIEPSMITIEVTESRLMENLTSALEILTRLYMKGVSLSIDDFGTGYSSMEQLRRVPFNELKIDRSFVSRADSDSAAMAIMESSVELAKKLNMSIVAEGVETAEQWQLVDKMGCDKIQGYYVAKPMGGNDIFAWVDSWHAENNVTA